MNKVRFFVKLAVLLAAAFVILSVLNSFYVRGYYYNDIYGEVQNFLKEIPNDIEICNFGSSHGLASFKYDKVEEDLNAFNFAFSGEDFYHNYAKLQQYSDHLKEGCVVFLPVSYFSFCNDTKAPSDKRYYLFLDKKYIKGYSLETYLNVKYFPVLRSGDGLLKDLVNEEKMASIFYDDKNAKEEEPVLGQADVSGRAAPNQSAANSANTLNPEELYNSSYVPSDAELYDFSDLRSKSWHSMFKTNDIYMEENIKILTEMVEYCLDHKFIPILVSTPINHVLNDMFTDDELEKYFYDPINEVVAKTGVEYLDYSHDKCFSENNKYYSNADHFNSVGGKAFTEEMMNYLKEKGLR